MDGTIVTWLHRCVWTCQSLLSVFVNQATMTQDTQGKYESQVPQQRCFSFCDWVCFKTWFACYGAKILNFKFTSGLSIMTHHLFTFEDCITDRWLTFVETPRATNRQMLHVSILDEVLFLNVPFVPEILTFFIFFLFYAARISCSFCCVKMVKKCRKWFYNWWILAVHKFYYCVWAQAFLRLVQQPEFQCPRLWLVLSNFR